MNSTNKLINQYYQLPKKHLPNLNIHTIFSPVIICLLAYLFIGLFPPPAAGDTVSNDNYSVNVGNIDTNPQPTPKSQAPQVLGTTSTQKPEFTTGPNYTVNALSDVSLALFQNTIDFGILSSTNPVLRTSQILLSSSKPGAQLLVSENHPLFSTTQDTIPNTSCDNGSCTSEIAASWNNTLTYGFGYRCDSTQIGVCDSQFSDSNYYEPYPDLSQNQSEEAIMLSNSTNAKASVTYKVNISGTQKTGGYYNSITYLAIPNF